MSQLHLYVPESVAELIRKRANAAGQTVSRYLASVVLKEFGPDWPRGFFEEVMGGWKGEPLERPPQGAFETREEL